MRSPEDERGLRTIMINYCNYYDVHVHIMCAHMSLKLNIAYVFIAFTFSNSCTYQENLDAKFFRHVIVFTPFAATALGLASICLLALYQHCKRRKMLQVVAMSDQARANIQISESSWILHG